MLPELKAFIVAAEKLTDEEVSSAFNALDWQSQETLKRCLYASGFLTPTELEQYDVLLILRQIAHHFSLSEYLCELIIEEKVKIGG